MMKLGLTDSERMSKTLNSMCFFFRILLNKTS